MTRDEGGMSEWRPIETDRLRRGVVNVAACVTAMAFAAVIVAVAGRTIVFLVGDLLR